MLTQAGLYLLAAEYSANHAGSFAFEIPGPSYLWTDNDLFQLAKTIFSTTNENAFDGLYWQDQAGAPFKWHGWRLVGYLDEFDAQALSQSKPRVKGYFTIGTAPRGADVDVELRRL